MKLSSILYQFLIKIYTYLPFKSIICLAIKGSGISVEKFYRDLNFKNSFFFKFGNYRIRILHYGGTIENEFFWHGLKNWERDTVWLWMYLTPKSEVILDVGANIGAYSLIAKTINPNASVHAFEPSENAYSKLMNNIKLNDLEIQPHKIALSNFSGQQVFYDVKSGTSLGATLSAEMTKNIEGLYSYQVETKTLDQFIQEYNIERIDLIKVDVEMHEPEFLEGFRLILEYRPIIFIEILTDEVAVKLNDLLNGLKVLFFELGHNKLKPIEKLTKGRPYFWNFLIVPEEKKDLIMHFCKNN